MKTSHLFLSKTLLFISVFFVTTCTYAQNQSDIKAVKITDNMNEQLTLSNQQYDQILDLNKKYLKKTDDLKNNESGSVKRESFSKVINEWDSELEKVLTKEQYEKYKENKSKARSKKGRNNR